jgi:4-hydroxy-tetrahydrodipicolinate reductase
MKIALIGYGKMGKMIEAAALLKGHSIVAKVSKDQIENCSALQQAQVWIDFSHPNCVMENIKKGVKLGKDLVIGTTGWYENLDAVKELVADNNIGFLYSPNFSLGVNLFLKIVAEAAKLMNHIEYYDVSLFESHHNKKADSPSGTAKAIADLLINNITHKNKIVCNAEGQIEPDALHIASLRCGSIPGTHSVIFDSPADSLTLTHQARNREGFASGAVAAAEWLKGKKGFFTIEDMIGG